MKSTVDVQQEDGLLWMHGVFIEDNNKDDNGQQRQAD